MKSKYIFSQFVAIFIVVVHSLSAQEKSMPEAISGSWIGDLDAGSRTIKIIFHINEPKKGAVAVSIDIPHHGGYGVPATDVKLEKDKLTFRVPKARSRYEGVFNPEKKTLAGKWSQGDRNRTLLLKKQKQKLTKGKKQ